MYIIYMYEYACTLDKDLIRTLQRYRYRVRVFSYMGLQVL